MSGLRPVLFLDFDGVLHPEGRDAEPFCRVEMLWQILRAYPAVDVVFSTSWRELHSFDELLNFATCNGGEDLAERFVGVTPVLPYRIERVHHRESECREWLWQNQQAERPWLALDDIGRWFAGPNLYLVGPETGLTAEDVSAVVERLQDGSRKG